MGTPSLEQSIDYLSIDLDEVRGELEGVKENLEDRLQTIRKEVHALQKHFDDDQYGHKDSDRRLNHLEDFKKGITSRIDGVSVRIDGMSARLGHSRPSTKACNTPQSSVPSSESFIKEAITRLEQDVKSFKADRDAQPSPTNLPDKLEELDLLIKSVDIKLRMRIRLVNDLVEDVKDRLEKHLSDSGKRMIAESHNSIARVQNGYIKANSSRLFPLCSPLTGAIISPFPDSPLEINKLDGPALRAILEQLGAGGVDGPTDSIYVAMAAETDPFGEIWARVRGSRVMEEASKEKKEAAVLRCKLRALVGLPVKGL